MCGPRGSGKTSILKAMAGLLEQTPACLAACTWLDCREQAGESLPTLQRRLLTKVLWHAHAFKPAKHTAKQHFNCIGSIVLVSVHAGPAVQGIPITRAWIWYQQQAELPVFIMGVEQLCTR